MPLCQTIKIRPMGHAMPEKANIFATNNNLKIFFQDLLSGGVGDYDDMDDFMWYGNNLRRRN